MTMRLVPMLLVSLALAGCPKSGDSGPGPGSGPSTPPTPPPATPADAAPAPPPTPAAQHEACSDATGCATGLTCVKFTGVTGREMATCEIPCEPNKTTCPSGQTCKRAVDGPGQVCMSGPPDTGTGSGSGSGNSGGGGGGTSKLPKQTEACPDGKCASDLTCVEYYGIAGTRGPKFTSCEIPCKGGAACPKGQTCHTVADGPGQVCRP